MKERPILFSGPMVRAILEGRKTQTRRVVKRTKMPECDTLMRRPQAFGPGTEFFMDAANPVRGGILCCNCPYGVPGDRLYARETWRRNRYANNWQDVCIEYAAGGEFWCKDPSAPKSVPESKWRPSIHMPRWASRITLEVVSVRVERLQAISEEDAKAEGVEPYRCPQADALMNAVGGGMKPIPYTSGFANLWNEINGKTYPWSSNCWVWVVEFRRITG